MIEHGNFGVLLGEKLAIDVNLGLSYAAAGITARGVHSRFHRLFGRCLFRFGFVQNYSITSGRFHRDIGEVRRVNYATVLLI